MLALGTVVEAPARPLEETEFHCGILDFYDHWTEIDPRLASYHAHLSKWSEAFGHDLVDLATYAHEILCWLEPTRIRNSQAVIVAGSMTQAFVVSVRMACDAVAAALAYVACEKPGQAPSDSLRALSQWAKKHPTRVRASVAELLSGDLTWFWDVRSIRDYLVHDGCRANIHCDGRQFNLWVFSERDGWILRTALLPLLRNHLQKLIGFADRSAEIISRELALPDDRHWSRVVAGVLVPALHRLIAVADQYAEPSP